MSHADPQAADPVTPPAEPPSAVFVVGCPRSGTSVLYKTLAHHPYFATTTNLTRRFGARMGLVRVAELVGAGHRPVEAMSLWAKLRERGDRERTEADVTDDDRAALRKLVDDHRRHFDRPIFLSKWPGHSLWVRWLAEALPDARFVHCLRDGRAVACSILRESKKAGHNWAYMGSSMWPDLRHMDMASYSGALWSRVSRTCAAALEHVDPARVLTVRYEAFVRDTAATLDRLQEHCGIVIDQALRATLPALDDRNDKWRSELTDDERAAVLAAAADGLTAFGYGGADEAATASA